MTDSQQSAVDKIGILGAGQMGGGIAQVAATTGYSVLLADADVARAEAGKARIAKQLGRQVEKGKLDGDARDAILARITAVGGLSEFANADLAIEAATENIELKKKLFRDLEAVCRPDIILASNTSSISITSLSAQTKRPDKVIGMHFMNPVPVMKLVEVIRGLPTSDATYATTVAVAEKMGKTVITSGDCPGFLVNRILIPFINEACFALQEGLGTAEDIDTGGQARPQSPHGAVGVGRLDWLGHHVGHCRCPASRTR